MELRERGDPDGFLKTLITREGTNSRRFSASNLRSFREETRSFRRAANISSTASSPGYTSRDQIDPSTYSFTAALKALQTRSGSGWECLTSLRNAVSDGIALNSKWDEAEKYISNPLSGQVPMECLSAKTLSGRYNSIPPTISRTAKSAPLIFSHARLIHMRPNITYEEEELISSSPTTEFEEAGVRRKKISTRDVGIQSTPLDISSSSSNTSLNSSPQIKESSLTSLNSGGSPSSNEKPKIEEQEVDMKEKQEEKEEEQEQEEEDDIGAHKCRFGGCLAPVMWLRKQQKRKEKQLE